MPTFCSDRAICLFDVDGTVTEPRKVISAKTKEFMKSLRSKVTVGLVGGSDLVKILEQLDGKYTLNEFDYVFSENGLVAHKAGELFSKKSIADQMGEEKLQSFINYALGYMSKIQLPVKRGTFVEFRNGLINISPIGRSCSQAERDQFNEYDRVHKIRETFVEDLVKEFGESGLVFAIGGQISIDVFPKGWDKTYCLQFLTDKFDTIHFFGDKTAKGGNDHEIFEDPRTIGHTVTSPEDMIRQVSEIFFT